MNSMKHISKADTDYCARYSFGFLHVALCKDNIIINGKGYQKVKKAFSETMITRNFLTTLLIIISFYLSEAQIPKNKSLEYQKAERFMNEQDRQLNKLTTEASYAVYDWNTNITEYNRKIKEKTDKKLKEYAKEVFQGAQNIKWKAFKYRNLTLFRWFQIVATGQGLVDPSSLFSAGSENSANLYTKMQEIHGKVKVCPPKGSRKGCTSDMFEIFSKSRDPKVRKHYWLEYRTQTGEKYKDLFLKAIKKDNEEARSFGYKNKASYNIGLYQDKDFEKTAARELRKLLPLYKQIHAYVRKKLRRFYKKEKIKKDGPIPAHLLGDHYSQKWDSLMDIVKPYPMSSGLPNVTKTMLKKKMEVIDMFIMAEKFFKSLGLKSMTPRFWSNSMMVKPNDRDVVCHASAHDFNNGKDYRIKLCAAVNIENLEVIHHEMGHVEYYMSYYHNPFIFRDAANPGVHEAIGDSIALSVLTPKYLKQVGLLKKGEIRNNKEFQINFLLEMALKFVVPTPYNYIIDLWRNQVYRGTVKKDDLNKKYWQARLAYQGVCPPTKRTEKNFDIGAKYHIAGGVEYTRYYVASLFQFMIHKILCTKASHRGPLHECSIYKNKKAGEAFAKFLSNGKSKHWKSQLISFSEGKFNNLNILPTLEYFQPLYDWLEKNNSNEYIGWKSKDPMSCPGGTAGSDDIPSDTTDIDTTNSGQEGTEETGFTESKDTESDETPSDTTDIDTTNSGQEGTEETDEIVFTESKDTTGSDETSSDTTDTTLTNSSLEGAEETGYTGSKDSTGSDEMLYDLIDTGTTSTVKIVTKIEDSTDIATATG